jgi:hypothetical protein
MQPGDIYTIAGNGAAGYGGDGGPAANARPHTPDGVTVDGSGNVVTIDFDNARLRAVAASTGTFFGQAMSVGDIYAVAGNGTFGFAGEGGPATTAELRAYITPAVDAMGNLIIPDGGNHRIRVAAAATGTFYGVAMTAGDVYTVAGSGTFGYAGDGFPATSASMLNPTGVTVDGREPAHRRSVRRGGPRSRGDSRDVLRPGDDSWRHLHGGR